MINEGKYVCTHINKHIHIHICICHTLDGEAHKGEYSKSFFIKQTEGNVKR